MFTGISHHGRQSPSYDSPDGAAYEMVRSQSTLSHVECDLYQKLTVSRVVCNDCLLWNLQWSTNGFL